MKGLEGVRVLDLTHMLSGPYGAMLLSDMGTDTIKVEPPGKGEGTRRLQENDPENSVHGMGSYFLTLNRNKRSVCIDLKSEEGLEAFYKLVEKSDVVFDNFSAGVPKRLKIDHESLSRINPRIITCSLTGFGETGPLPDRPAFDMVAQGMGGGMSITGPEGDGPYRSGIPIGDLGGGLFAAIGILQALLAREKTGRGQHVDISMLDAQISLLNYMATMFLLSGVNPGPLGNAHFVHVPYNTFPTASFHIIIAVIFDKFWDNLMEVVDIPELRDNADYRTQPGRYRDRDLINAKLSEALREKPGDYWLGRLREKRIPCAPVNNFERALSDPQILARNMVVSVTLPEGDEVRMPGNPVKLSETYEDTFSPPPKLGQHTAEVFGEVAGLPPERIAALIEKGVLG
ncbi:MAG: CaiB/BaiF CoA-transferase family protein [Alphaproteobacteria bacterium]